jgi:hypothetical protein
MLNARRQSASTKHKQARWPSWPSWPALADRCSPCPLPPPPVPCPSFSFSFSLLPSPSSSSLLLLLLLPGARCGVRRRRSELRVLTQSAALFLISFNAAWCMWTTPQPRGTHLQLRCSVGVGLLRAPLAPHLSGSRGSRLAPLCVSCPLPGSLWPFFLLSQS